MHYMHCNLCKIYITLNKCVDIILEQVTYCIFTINNLICIAI